MITDKMQTELMFFLSFYFQSILFVHCAVGPASASAENQGKVFQCLKVLLFESFGWENKSQVTYELCAIFLQQAEGLLG